MKIFTAAFLRFDRQLAANGQSKNARVAYLHDLRRFVDWFGNQALAR